MTIDRRQFLRRSASVGGWSLGFALTGRLNPLLSLEQEIRWSRRFDTLVPAVYGNVVISGVGDIVLAESVYYDLPNEARILLGLLSGRSDIVIGNLAGTISDWGAPARKDVVIAPSTVVGDLRAAGMDILNLGNNHLLDTRSRGGGSADGLEQTLHSLHTVGIRAVGGGRNLDEATRPAVEEVREERVATLGFHTAMNWESPHGSVAAGPSSPGTAAVRAERLRVGFSPDDSMIVPVASDLERLEEAVEQAKGRAECLIVALNTFWTPLNGPSDSDIPPGLRLLAHTAVDAGADLVLGSGSHRILPVEQYRGGVICYDPGNFFFHLFENGEPHGRYGLFPEMQERIRAYAENPEYLESVVVRAVFRAGGVERVDFIPFIHLADGNPTLTDDERAGRIIRRLADESSRQFDGTNIQADAWHAWIETGGIA